MNWHRTVGCRWSWLALALVWSTLPFMAMAQNDAPGTDTPLAEQEQSLAERFARLELLAGRLAELSKATQPRRAELLEKLVASSREKDVPGRFKEIVAALRNDELNEASTSQTTLQTELQAMLELLLQEDRDRQIESERQRIAKYLAQLNKLIREQRGIKARTSGGDAKEELSEDQSRTAQGTGDLGDRIEQTEGKGKSSDEVEPSNSEGDQGAETKPDDGPSPGQQDTQRQGSGDQDSQEGKPSDSPSQQGDDSTPRQGQPSDSQVEPSKGEPSQGQPSQGQPSQGQPSQGQPSQGQPSQGQPSQGQPSSEESQSQQQNQSPSERAVEKLRRAQERMQQAQQRLKEAEREQAVEAQEQALRELEDAKAELEKILRQLREEEMERMLVLLEARFRKMLEAQNEVHDETLKLEEAAANIPEHELEIACASLGRKEDQIVSEADRALILLQEDGSSVAFPEALQQARIDMQTVARRLKQVKPDEVTQGLEEDIIATLEEILAALQKALKELRQQRSSQQPSAGGEPGEQPLVDQLAELRMIRALQNRVNRRTLYYDSLMEKDHEQELELLDALQELADRQEHIFKATRDLSQGTNR